MTVKLSVSMHDDLAAFAQEEVASGRHVSLSAVLHESLRDLRAKREREARERAEEEAFLAMLQERAKGPFLSEEVWRAGTDRMIAEERRRLGLDG